MKENLLIDKSIAFASRIIKLHQYLIKTKKETIISYLKRTLFHYVWMLQDKEDLTLPHLPHLLVVLRQKKAHICLPWRCVLFQRNPPLSE